METQNFSSNPLAKAGLIAGVSLVLGALFDYFFYEKIPGLALPLYVILIVAGLFALAHIFKKRINKEVFWLLLPLFFFSAMIFVRSSDLLSLLNAAASFLLLLVIAEISFGKKIKNFWLADYVKIFFLLFKFIRPLFQTLSDFFVPREFNKNRKTLSQIIKGAILAIPVLCVFLLLFSSADLIFQKYLSSFIAFNVEETVVQAILILIITLLLIGAFAYIFRKIEDRTVVPKDKIYSLGHIENSILLGSVNTLFLVFILVQLTYLFGGESNISAQGFTYADYARRGFFELIAVAVTALLLLLATEKYIAKKEAGHALGFKILSTALVVQTVVIMVSALTRLALYEEAYGFTTQRLYSHTFIFLLAAIFGLLLFKIYRDKKENAFALRAFIAIILFLVGMNLLNPDAFIARQNIARFATTGQLDVYYLSHLSDDALLDTIKILNIANDDLRKSFAQNLYQRAQPSPDAALLSGWQPLNLSRLRAKKILDANIKGLEPSEPQGDFQVIIN
jgi:hypothetical protein